MRVPGSGSRLTRTCPSAGCAAALAAALVLAPSPPSGAADAPATTARPATTATQPAAKGTTRAGTRAALQSVRAQIHRMRKQASRESRQRDQLTVQLRALELSLEKSADELDRLNGQINDYEVRRAATSAAQTQQDRALGGARAALGQELRSAYLLPRQSALEVWLTQRSPVAAARLLTYHHYLGQARAARIALLSAQLRHLGGLADKLAQQQADLAMLKQSQEQTQQQLAHERDQRQQVLQRLGAAARTRTERLASLTSEQSDLERVLRGLSQPRAGHAPAPATTPDTATAFGRLRGQLIWPVNGQISAAFGQERVSGVTWDGLVIATQRDTPVRAVSAGRVVYADWLPGLGLLAIVDHGDGYLSLYGHNDRLLKAVGTEVGAGEVIAAAGDTGGKAEPALYFEIRRAGKPIDPRPWFKTPQPTP